MRGRGAEEQGSGGELVTFVLIIDDGCHLSEGDNRFMLNLGLFGSVVINRVNYAG